MGKFVKGEIVVIPFPFSDLSNQKRRPALVVTSLQGTDIILCQITSQNSAKDKYSIPITQNDFKQGTLKNNSYVRPNRLFTADSNIVNYSVGVLKSTTLNKIISEINQIISN